MKNNILVVGAHADDDVLGAGATIAKHVANGDIVTILLLGDGETSRPTATNESIEKRKQQAQTAGKIMGVTKVITRTLPDNSFDSIPLLSVVKEVEEVIFSEKPNVIYTHNPNDLNVDHRLTFQAVLTACRPQPDFFVKKILAYEVLSSTEWQIKDAKNIFCPTEYVDVQDYLETKVKALQVYKDELRQYPHPRSEEGVRTLAKFRGLEVGKKACEAFQVIRNIQD